MIPDWNVAGVLPPIRPDKPGHDGDRSPYQVDFHQVVDRFGTTPERRKILRGFLDYRQALHNLGIVQGFQWLDGSFMEQVELLELRSPNDVDVVTFFKLPTGRTQQDLVTAQPNLFRSKQTKKQYDVDAYYYVLAGNMSSYHVKQIAYWYSMWSHRRDSLWKGFIQVDLSPAQDQAAEKALELMQQDGGQL